MRLAAAGSLSPRADAELLAAHLLGLNPGALRAAAVRGAAAPAGLEELVAARAAGTPVQHLTGRAGFHTLDLLVGPGVFVPRPETELVAGAAIEAAAQTVAARLAGGGREPVLVVDLCTGSGAIAAAIAHELPGVNVVAVESDCRAAEYARRNLAGRARLEIGDATDRGLLADLDSLVDVVVSNPPYIPDGATVSPEVAADPAIALYGGPRGWELPLRIAERAHGLLRPGGVLVLEHHDEGQPELMAAVTGLGFGQVTGHRDLAGRPRYLVARMSRPGRR